MEALLIVIAIVCFVLAAVPVLPRVPWLPVGLAFLSAGHIWSHLLIALR